MEYNYILFMNRSGKCCLFTDDYENPHWNLYDFMLCYLNGYRPVLRGNKALEIYQLRQEVMEKGFWTGAYRLAR